MARTPEEQKQWDKDVVIQRANWTEKQKAKARKDAARSLLHTDPEKGRHLLAVIRKEELQAEIATRKTRDRSIMSREWAQAGGDPDDFTDEVFEELYNQLVKARTLRASRDIGQPRNRPLRF